MPLDVLRGPVDVRVGVAGLGVAAGRALGRAVGGGVEVFPEADGSTYRRGVSCGLVDQGTRTVSNDCTREEEGHMVANCAERAPGLVVPPKRGTLMLWYNYDEEGKANTRAIHAGSCLHTVICRIRLRLQLLTR